MKVLTMIALMLTVSACQLKNPQPQRTVTPSINIACPQDKDCVQGITQAVVPTTIISRPAPHIRWEDTPEAKNLRVFLDHSGLEGASIGHEYCMDDPCGMLRIEKNRHRDDSPYLHIRILVYDNADLNLQGSAEVALAETLIRSNSWDNDTVMEAGERIEYFHEATLSDGLSTSLKDKRKGELNMHGADCDFYYTQRRIAEFNACRLAQGKD